MSDFVSRFIDTYVAILACVMECILPIGELPSSEKTKEPEDRQVATCDVNSSSIDTASLPIPPVLTEYKPRNKVFKKAKNIWLRPPLKPLTSSVVCPSAVQPIPGSVLYDENEINTEACQPPTIFTTSFTKYPPNSEQLDKDYGSSNDSIRESSARLGAELNSYTISTIVPSDGKDKGKEGLTIHVKLESCQEAMVGIRWIFG